MSEPRLLETWAVPARKQVNSGLNADDSAIRQVRVLILAAIRDGLQRILGFQPSFWPGNCMRFRGWFRGRAGSFWQWPMQQ